MLNFENNLSCFSNSALYKELTDIHNNSVLSEQERVDQMVNRISSVINCAALTGQRESSKKEKKKKHKRKQIWYDNDWSNKHRH